MHPLWELNPQSPTLVLSFLDQHALPEKFDLPAAARKLIVAPAFGQFSGFFEDLAMESKISAEKPLIMRNALTARKTLIRRAKTIKYESRKQSSSKYQHHCCVSFFVLVGVENVLGSNFIRKESFAFSIRP